jgi:hypothetical protein
MPGSGTGYGNSLREGGSRLAREVVFAFQRLRLRLDASGCSRFGRPRVRLAKPRGLTRGDL